MPLKIRENPETGLFEVMVNGDWIDFNEYRRKQIDTAYQSSIKFLRDRLGEDFANRELNHSTSSLDE